MAGTAEQTGWELGTGMGAEVLSALGQGLGLGDDWVLHAAVEAADSVGAAAGVEAAGSVGGEELGHEVHVAGAVDPVPGGELEEGVDEKTAAADLAGKDLSVGCGHFQLHNNCYHLEAFAGDPWQSFPFSSVLQS